MDPANPPKWFHTLGLPQWLWNLKLLAKIVPFPIGFLIIPAAYKYLRRWIFGIYYYYKEYSIARNGGGILGQSCNRVLLAEGWNPWRDFRHESDEYWWLYNRCKGNDMGWRAGSVRSGGVSSYHLQSVLVSPTDNHRMRAH
jgi:hypothetical protein